MSAHLPPPSGAAPSLCLPDPSYTLCGRQTTPCEYRHTSKRALQQNDPTFKQGGSSKVAEGNNTVACCLQQVASMGCTQAAVSAQKGHGHAHPGVHWISCVLHVCLALKMPSCCVATHAQFNVYRVYRVYLSSGSTGSKQRVTGSTCLQGLQV
eukprot:1158274-Pelagomonas_calceolata.AAC.22